MVDKKITELTELTVPASADVVAIVDDPSGTPETKKITYANIESNLSITAIQVSDFDTEVSNNTDVTANTAKVTYPSADSTKVGFISVTQAVDLDTMESDITVNNSKVTNATHTGDVTGDTTLTIGADKVLDSHINWGTGATQVNTADIPELTNLYYTEARVSANTDVSSNTTHSSSDGKDHSDVVANNAKVSNVSTDLSAGTRTSTTIDVNSSDGTNATLVEADTTNAGILGSDKWDDIVANTSTRHAESHTIVSHSDTTATGAELDTLTGGGDTTLHDHDGISENTAARHTQGTDTALGSGAVAADHGTGTTDQIINVSYGTSATPPTASTTTEGSIYIQYTA